MKEKHLDFILRDDDYRKIVFRFYPKQSHMHSFDENPPASMNEVYKVYYAWGILQYWKDEDGNQGSSERIFYMPCDECSALLEMEYVIRRILRHRKRRTQVLSFGQPGSMWTITFFPHHVWGEDGNKKIDPSSGVLAFEVFDNWDNLGYRFELEIQEAVAFAEYLHKVNHHMLENGEPI